MSESKKTRTDAEINAALRQESEMAKKRQFMLIGGAVLIVVGYIVNGIVGIGMMGVGVLVAVLGFAAGVQSSKDVKDTVGNQLAKDALDEVFSQVDYRPAEHIGEYAIRSTDMGFPFYYDDVGGSDLVRATYRGVRVEMSDITLSTVRTIFHEGEAIEHEAKEERVPRFKGQWVICDFGKRLSGAVTLAARKGGIAKSLTGKEISTESEGFNKRFAVFANDAHDAFYILTPHMMECLVALADNAGGKVYLSFLAEGKLHIALDTGRDFFEVGSLMNVEATTLRNQYVSEIRFVTNLLDELLENEALFAKS